MFASYGLAGHIRGRALLAVVAMAMVGMGAVLVPAASAAGRSSVTLGIHDGAINSCDNNERQTTPPTASELAAATSSLTNRYWAALRVHTVRFSPPWDIAYHHDPGGPNSPANQQLAVAQACLNAWLAGVKAVGATPQIAFKPDPNYHSPNGVFVGAPDIHTYRLAIDAFTAQYSNPPSIANGMARVQIISPWGEPDLPGARVFMPKGGHNFADPNCHGSPNVNTCGPILAAHMWRAVHLSCGCALLGKPLGTGVIAGDFSSLGGIRGPEAGPGGLRGSYLDTYRKNLSGLRPTVWGLHPYSDISAFEKADVAHSPIPTATLVGAFARDLSTVGYHQNTQIWLNEISAFQYHSMNGHPEPTWTPKVQAAAGHYLLTGLPHTGGVAEPVVTRLYYLNFQAAASDPTNSRWALVLHSGTQPQPIYFTFANR